MNWKEAFEAWFDDTGRVDYRPELCIAWYSAIEWMRSQQEPVAWFIDDAEGDREYNAKPEFSRGRTRGTPLYAAPVPREPDGWHVGDSDFESWFATYDPAGKGDKQRARDAYAAGMGERKPADGAMPEGWKLVPVEPTKEMVNRAEAIDWGDADVRGSCCNQWQAMLAAAPEYKEE